MSLSCRKVISKPFPRPFLSRVRQIFLFCIGNDKRMVKTPPPCPRPCLLVPPRKFASQRLIQLSPGRATTTRRSALVRMRFPFVLKSPCPPLFPALRTFSSVFGQINPSQFLFWLPQELLIQLGFPCSSFFGLFVFLLLFTLPP